MHIESIMKENNRGFAFSKNNKSDMKFLLRLKHWQLFAITWGLSILLNVFTISNPILMTRSFPFMMILFAMGTFGWIWAISTNLKLPEGVYLNVKKFRVLFSIPIIYIIAITFWLGLTFFGVVDGYENSNPISFIAVIIPLHLISMIIIIWGMLFAAKTLKSVELGRLAAFSEYTGDFFLIWFSIIGYWIIQPRINRIIEESHVPGTL